MLWQSKRSKTSAKLGSSTSGSIILERKIRAGGEVRRGPQVAVSRANNNTETVDIRSGVCPLIKLNNVSRARSVHAFTGRAGANSLRPVESQPIERIIPTVYFSSFSSFMGSWVEGTRISTFSLESRLRRAIFFFLPSFLFFLPSRMLIIPIRFPAINHFGRDTFRVRGLLVGSAGIIFTVINGWSRVLIPELLDPRLFHTEESAREREGGLWNLGKENREGSRS